MSFVTDLFGGGDGGASDAADAQVKAQNKSIDFYKQIFNKQIQLDAPSRAVGNQALQALGGLWGFNPGVDPYPVSGIDATSGGGAGAASNYTAANLIGPQNETNPATGNNRDWLRHCSVHPDDTACASHFKPPTAAGGASGAGGTGSANPYANQGGTNPLLTFLQNDPGYKFRLDQGQQSLDRQGAAAGRFYSGAQLKATQRYGQDYASGEFSNAYNRLASLAGLGQTANANTSNNLGQLGQNVGQGLQNIGDARASGYINAAQGKQNGFNNLLGAAGTAALFLSSEDFKDEIVPAKDMLDDLNALDVKKWKYRPEMGMGDDDHIGPMAEQWKEVTGLGDGKSISVVDVMGILMKSVQELSAKVDQLEAR